LSGTEKPITRPRLDADEQVSIERVFRDHEGQCTCRRHHMIDPTSGPVPKPHVPDRRFAEGTELELQAVPGGPCRRTPPTGPVGLREAEIRVVRAVLVIEPDESRRRAVNGMADVVHGPTVAIAPGVRYFHGSHVVLEERPAEFAPCFGLEGHARGVLHHQEPKGVGNCALPGGLGRREITRVLSLLGVHEGRWAGGDD
jgi:hypothetical protein